MTINPPASHQPARRGLIAMRRAGVIVALGALLPVPLDYSNPAGPQIKIAISRILHTSPDYQGVI